MNTTIITIRHENKNSTLNITDKLNMLACKLEKYILYIFKTHVEYYQIIRNEKTLDVDLEKMCFLSDFEFKNGDILYVNNPHAKATIKNITGDIQIVFKFEEVSVFEWIKKEQLIANLYYMIKKQNVFCDNFCLKYDGTTLNRFSNFTVFDCGIKDGDIIEIYGDLLHVHNSVHKSAEL